MKKYFTELTNSNWFFVSLTAFAIALPLSVALVSVMAGVILVVALVEDSWENKITRLKSRKLILLIPLIFEIYLISTAVTLKYDHSLYDIKKVMFYLVIPFAFALGKELSRKQKRFIFYAFAVSVLVAIGVALVRWIILPQEGNFSVHNISLISHIRFSFQLILVFWFVVFFSLKNYSELSKRQHVVLAGLLIVYLGFLVFQQSLTGIVAFGTGLVYFLYYLINRTKGEYKVPVIVVFFLLILVPVLYLTQSVKNFYQIDWVEADSVENFTSEGNQYKHDFSNKMIENGHYVGLYVCETEMRNEWDKISEYKYDSRGRNGYPLSSTLIRYLTSKNLRKDAEGVRSLSETDIRNIEEGMANFIFAKKYSLYPRIYQTIWEYYVFSQTGYSNNQSFSQRIEFARAAINIIKKHPLLGVGTGKWKQEFANSFREINSQLDESLYASSHNQYLNFMVKFGIAGFIVIMFLLIYPIVKTGRYHDQLFMVFLVFMFFANFADSNLESHMGSSFFFFFYCLFLIGPKEYLNLEIPELNQKKIK